MTVTTHEPTVFDIVPVQYEPEQAKPAKQQPLNNDQYIKAIAMILKNIIQSGSAHIYSADDIENKTIFHAKNEPQISIESYLQRFVLYAQCELDVLICALIYFDRIAEKAKDFTLDTYNIHKLLLVGLSVACKFCDDRYYTNKYYAEVGGVSAEDFNKLEEEFLVNYLNFNMFVKPEVFENYCNDITSYYYNQQE